MQEFSLILTKIKIILDCSKILAQRKSRLHSNFMKIRQAVSILLTPDPGSTEVFLVERNPKLSFFGGYFAFPGGTLDKEDADLPIVNVEHVGKDQEKYLVAAAREIFEETGILLTHGQEPISEEALKNYRRQLLDDKISFAKILHEHRHFIDARDFHPIAQITTPEFAPVRYETQFYWVTVPEGRKPEIWPGELLSGKFLTADEALKLWRQGLIKIVPPLIIMLQELSGKTVQTFTEKVRALADSYRQGKLHRVYFSPGVQMLPFKTRTLPPATHTNMYIVGEEILYLIDPAPSDPEQQEKLWDYLNNLKKEGRRFKAILLTHHHSDHVGALQACMDKYQLPVWAHPLTAEKLPHIKFTRFINHGDQLELGRSPDGQSNWKLRVYHTPGHARGHLVFQESRYGAVLAGDMISTISTIVISPPEGHLATYLKSLEFLKTIATDTLYPAHGPAVVDGQKVIQYYLNHRKERELKLIKSLKKGARTISELVQEVYDDVEPQLWPLAEHSLRAGVIKLMEEGRCIQEGNKYRLT